MQFTGFSDKEIVKGLIARRHPEYEALLDHWRFCDACYEGGRKWLNEKNVFKFYKEGKSEYDDRLKRTYRANHTKRVVDTITEYLFKQQPTRSAAAPALVESFWKNVDRRKGDIQDFVRSLDRKESIFGRVYVVVDRPAQLAANRKDEKLPYVYVIKPTHLLDMGFDDEGVLLWVLMLEDYRDDSSPLASGKCLKRYRLWTQNEWYLFGPISPDKPDEIVWLGEANGYGEHNLGVVPVIPHGSKDGSEYAAPAMIADIAYMDRALCNYGALLDEILYEQTFSQLVMPAEAVLPGTTESNQMIAAAKNRIFLYNGNSPRAPEFISPDATQAQLLIEASNTLMKSIYACTGTDNDANSQSQSTGKSYASGKVRQFDHAQIENMLLGKARTLEATEDAVLAIVFKWMSDDEEVDGNWVRYPTDFDVRGLMADLDISVKLYSVTGPVTVMREQMKSTVEKLFPRKTPAELEAMKATIDEWVPEFQVNQQLAKAAQDTTQQSVDQAGEQIDNTHEIATQQVEISKKIADKPTPKPAPSAPARK